MSKKKTAKAGVRLAKVKQTKAAKVGFRVGTPTSKLAKIVGTPKKITRKTKRKR